MSFGPFKLNSMVNANASMDPDDTVNTKYALKRVGHFRTPSYGLTPYPDEPLFDAVKSFQKAEGLKVDGIMNPDRETHTRLNQRLAEKAAQSGSRPPSHSVDDRMKRRGYPADGPAGITQRSPADLEQHKGRISPAKKNVRPPGAPIQRPPEAPEPTEPFVPKRINRLTWPPVLKPRGPGK